jgi:hypothetical protein
VVPLTSVTLQASPPSPAAPPVPVPAPPVAVPPRLAALPPCPTPAPPSPPSPALQMLMSKVCPGQTRLKVTVWVTAWPPATAEGAVTEMVLTPQTAGTMGLTDSWVGESTVTVTVTVPSALTGLVKAGAPFTTTVAVPPAVKTQAGDTVTVKVCPTVALPANWLPLRIAQGPGG